ncbi:hypothetical protein JXR93_06100 [bacterium]|nr:hypothetical protein [bacterium]
MKEKIDGYKNLLTNQSIYFGDALVIKEIQYRYGGMITKNHLERVRVVDKNSLGESLSNVDINSAILLKNAIKNSKAYSILPEKDVNFEYLYQHNRVETELSDLSERFIKSIESQINKKYPKKDILSLNFSIKHYQKSYVNTIGTQIVQHRKSFNFQILTDFFYHQETTPFLSEKTIELPTFKKTKNSSINLKNIYLSPKSSGFLINYLSKFSKYRDILPKISIDSYIYNSLQGHLYDDEGTIRKKTGYIENVKGVSIFEKGEYGYQFYSFDDSKFKTVGADISIERGDELFSNIKKGDYTIIDSISNITLKSNQTEFDVIQIDASLSLYKSGVYEGSFRKKLGIGFNSIKNMLRFFEKEVNGFNSFSIESPYIMIEL